MTTSCWAAVSSAPEATRAEDLAARFAGDPTKVVNMLSVADGEQVMLRVHVSEMQRNIAKQFGMNLASAENVGGANGRVLLQSFALLGHAINDLMGGQVGQVCNRGRNGTQSAWCLQGGGPATSRTTSRARSTRWNSRPGAHLAEPNLTAVSGETAKFLAGGEFPVPVGRDSRAMSQSSSSSSASACPSRRSCVGRPHLASDFHRSQRTHQYRRLHAAGRGRQRLGGDDPRLNVRRAETTVELPSGGSFAIAGLMQHTSKQVIDAFPGLKDMPVLGALFRSRDYQNGNRTGRDRQRLSGPARCRERLAAPTDGFVTPTDPETILLGRLNTVYKENAKPPRPRRLPRPASSSGRRT